MVPLARAPYPRLVLWTALALLPIAGLIGAMMEPVNPDCFEGCDLGQRFAAFGLRLVTMLWLLVVLMVAWSWRTREPTVAAVSAVVAGLLLIPVALRVSGVSHEVFTADLYVVAWVLSLGLQLPAVWRLSWRRRPSTPLRIVVAVMNLTVAVAAVALVLLGTSVVWGAGPTVVFACWIVFVVCLIPIIVAAWRDNAAAGSLVGPLLAGSVPILLLPAAIAVPGGAGYYGVVLVLPLSAVAWVWIAMSWLRARETPRRPIDDSFSSTAPSDIGAP
jgi:hypothetical protein